MKAAQVLARIAVARVILGVAVFIVILTSIVTPVGTRPKLVVR